MSTPSIDADLALTVGVRLAAVAFALASLEQFSVRSVAFGPTGPFSEAMALVYGRGVSRSRALERAFTIALYTNVLAGIALVLLGAFHALSPALLLIALGGNLVVRRRRITASDGAEQMTMLIMVAALLASVPFAGPGAVEVAVWFIAGQAVLSYSAAGLAKAFSSAWRSGAAVPTILGSEAHGHEYASRLLTRHPTLGTAVTRFVVVFECTFWLTLVSPWPVAAAILALALAFHVGNAVFMGLNSFVWAFPATYLSVWYVAQQVSPWW
jgi:hypothetical protein